MEKKVSGRQTVENKMIHMIKALLCSYIVTGLMLVILTVLLYKAGLGEGSVNAGIILVYVLSTFAGGFVLGKAEGRKKFIWGLLMGAIYFILLLLITLGVYHSLQGTAANIFTTFLLCAGGGMLGGMVS